MSGSGGQARAVSIFQIQVGWRWIFVVRVERVLWYRISRLIVDIYFVTEAIYYLWDVEYCRTIDRFTLMGD